MLHLLARCVNISISVIQTLKPHIYFFVLMITFFRPVEDMRVVNAFVISITLVTGKGGSNQTIPYSIRFAHIKVNLLSISYT